jgi:hypothetical protein
MSLKSVLPLENASDIPSVLTYVNIFRYNKDVSSEKFYA